MNKQQLASRIWASANKMRSKIEAHEYKDYILGFIFYKFLSEKQEKYLFEDGWTESDLESLDENDIDTLSYVRKNIGYFIPYKHLFSHWLELGMDFGVADVTDALSSFDNLIDSSYEKVFKNIFHTLETGLSKLGDTSGAQTKAIRGLIDLIKDIPMDGRQDYDVLGFIYEYLISNFAANAGKKAGEFYTPHEVSLLMSEIVAHHLKDRQEIEIYDPTSGSGSLLINIGKSVAKHMSNSNNIKYYAQELKEATYNLTRMNLVMRGILPSNIITRCGDTLDKDWPFFDNNHNYTPLYVDAVVSNPPYSQPWDPSNHEADIRYSRFGLAPKSKADYAFLLHDLYHVKPDGIMAIVLPHGVLFRGGEEGKIRQNLVNFNHIDTIIGLPANIFFGTGIPTIIMVLKQKRDRSDILFVDASKHFLKVGKNNVLQESNIKRIVDAVTTRSTNPKFSRLVSKEEIRKNDYNLNIPRYVDSNGESESFDLYATMCGGIPNREIESLKPYFDIAPSLKKQLFISIEGKPYSSIVNGDIKKIIEANEEIKSFKKRFHEAFSGFDSYLYSRLIANVESAKIQMEESIISDNLFARLEPFSIVDKYDVYQMLDDSFKTIIQDIEIIQTEGIKACKQTDPNLIAKKKDGKEVEVQDGWNGHIFPFEIVQKHYFESDVLKIKELENRINVIAERYDEIIESLSEDDKNSKFLNEEGNAFVLKEVSAFVNANSKNPINNDEESLENKVIAFYSLVAEEKCLKNSIKDLEIKLEEKTIKYIESLDVNSILKLLNLKWIIPLVEKINLLPDSMGRDLVVKVKKLGEKYENTMTSVSQQIATSEKALSNMLDDLVGDELDMKGIAEFKKMLIGDENE